MTTLYHSILGLPRSGKTTYLAALWHQIDAGEVSTKLVLDKLVGDHEYLNSIVEAWRRCAEVPRTPREAETNVTIHVSEPATSRPIVLRFPDLSGESFEDQFLARSCKPEYVSSYSADGGILLFVNADRAQDGLTVLDLGPTLVEGTSEPAETTLKDWSADLVPEQVRLVELLQFLQQPPFLRRQRRLAVGVSAWDVVDQQISPESWLAREMPLLSQFLANNSQSFDVRVYGISAQGGDVTGDKRLELARKVPSKRVICVGPEVEPHDLTAPIVWLNGG
jgi:hypothetical protein